MSSDRIPCINPRCRRTAPAAKYEPGVEIICGKCWRSLPREIREQRRRLERYERRIFRKVERRVAQGTLSPEAAARIGANIHRQLNAQWAQIKRRFIEPDTPAGLESFLEEAGLS
jgi:hypothetical protein